MNLLVQGILLTLILSLVSPAQAQLTPGQERQLREFYERKRLNGPTGQLVTDQGTFRLLRVGTRTESLPLSFSGYGVGFRVDRVKSIAVSGPNDLIFETWSGESTTTNATLWGYLVHEALVLKWPHYPSKSPGMPFVVEDPATKAPKQLFIYDMEGFVRINFDDPAQWREKPLAPLGEYTPEERQLLAQFKAEEGALSRYAPRIGDEREWMERVEREAQLALAGTDVPTAPTEQTPSAPSSPPVDPATAEIGQKVCLEDGSSIRESTGILVGGQPTYRTVTGRARITAFIERIESSRAQLRNGGVMFFRSGASEAEPLQSFTYNDVQLVPGVLFWDALVNWRECAQ